MTSGATSGGGAVRATPGATGIARAIARPTFAGAGTMRVLNGGATASHAAVRTMAST